MVKKRAVKKKEANCAHCQSRLSWLIWGVVIILAILVLIWLLSLPSVGLSGKAALQTAAYMPAGSTLNFEVKVDGLKEMTVTFSENVKNLVIKSDEISKPVWNFGGLILSGFKVESADAEKISNIKFLLKVKEEDFKPAGLNLGEVGLYSENGKIEWQLAKEEGGYRYYKAESPAMGEFVIGRPTIKKAEPKTPEETVALGPEVSKEKPVEEAPAEETVEEPQPVEIAQPAPVKEKGFFGRVWEAIAKLFS